MEAKHDHPGIFVPPPLIFAATFFISIALQNFFPISGSFFETPPASIIGWIFIASNFAIGLPAFIQFLRTRNSLIPTKAATSLQTTGMYTFSRNPMYTGMLFVYSGLAFLVGTWWTFLLIPALIIIITNYVIKREEKYLERAFGQTYLEYKKQVRRWI
jgi:protein-S-isoprenylcysteine O-methyltransferase Ste14